MANKKTTTKRSSTAVVRKVSLEQEVTMYLQDEENCQAIEAIQKTTDRYRDKLSTRKFDFAQRYALEPKTLRDWAKYYGTTIQTIGYWLADPIVKQFIQEIQCDATKLYAAKMLCLREEALRVYLEILRTPLSDNNRSQIKETADKVMELMKPTESGSGTIQPAVNINIGGQARVTSEDTDIEVVGVKADKDENAD